MGCETQGVQQHRTARAWCPSPPISCRHGFPVLFPKRQGMNPRWYPRKRNSGTRPSCPGNRKAPAPGNRKMLLAGSILVIVIVIALAGYYLAPSLLGKGGAHRQGPWQHQRPRCLRLRQRSCRPITTPVLTLTPSPSPASTPAVTAVPTTEVQNGIPPGRYLGADHVRG